MNDIKRAIESLSDIKKQYECSVLEAEELKEEYAIEALEDNKNSVNALDLAIQVLEKQVAKKPKDGSVSTKAGVVGAKCICGRLIFGGELYCKRCGQKLDWSEV